VRKVIFEYHNNDIKLSPSFYLNGFSVAANFHQSPDVSLHSERNKASVLVEEGLMSSRSPAAKCFELLQNFKYS
jgi:hypothetical protein